MKGANRLQDRVIEIAEDIIDYKGEVTEEMVAKQLDTYDMFPYDCDLFKFVFDNYPNFYFSHELLTKLREELKNNLLYQLGNINLIQLNAEAM